MRVRSIATGLFLLLSLSGSVFALIGPPTAELGKGQWSGGFNYSYSSLDLGKETVKYIHKEFDADGQETYNSTGSYSLKIEDFDMDRYYGRVGYGLLDSLEIYGQAGAINIKEKEQEAGDPNWYGYDSDTDFAWGLGVKYTFFRQEKINWGATAQINWFGANFYDRHREVYEDEEFTVTDTKKKDIDLDLMDLFIAVGPTVDMGSWKLYGGAIYQLITADYSYKERGHWTATDDTSGSSLYTKDGDYHKDSFGGYLGAQFNVYKNYDVQVEGLATGDGWGISAGIGGKL